MKKIKSVALAFALGSLGLFAGCGDSSTSTTTAQGTTPTGSPTSNATGGGTMVSAGVETEPAETVAIFLDSLRKGDERAANGVLTSLARQELAKTAYVIQPLGTPAGQYQIGRVSFPYSEKNVALVECTWTEPPVNGSPQEVMDIVCEVHQETEGWRISGIGVTIPGTDQALVLDFEDSASLQATIDAATGNVSPQSTSQVANGQLPPQSGLPAFPSDATNLPQASSNYPQIALPPLDNAPINR